MVKDSKIEIVHWYPWLNEIYRQILASYQNTKGYDVLLVKSRKNNGADSLIYALTRWLMCSDPVGIKSCNQCRNCCLMKSGYHPDYYQLKPENNMKSIGVDFIRILIDNLYKYPCIARCKIIYIKCSELLTQESINALLKIFEDPPVYVYFFLKCQSFRYLLPTLLSRCVRWVIFSPSEQVGLQWLYTQGVKDQLQAIAALRLSDRAPVEALSVLKSNDWLLRSKLCQSIRSIIENNNFFDIFLILERYCNRDTLLISWLISLFLDALKWHRGVRDFLVNIDQKDLICFIASKMSLLILHHQLQQWLICLYYWNNVSNINYKLLLSYQLLNCENNVMNFSY